MESLAIVDLTGETYREVLARLHQCAVPGGVRSYLEIGTETGATLMLARCASLAIDPAFRLDGLMPTQGKPVCALYEMTSDDFFAAYDARAILGRDVDLAFIDGLHHCDAVLRDFINVERLCHAGSTIALHDVLPIELPMAVRERRYDLPMQAHHAGWWTGDVWRAVLALKRHRPDLDIVALDAPPTGLICVTGLSPDSTVLSDRYEAIVAEMMATDLEEIGLVNYAASLRVRPTHGYPAGE